MADAGGPGSRRGCGSASNAYSANSVSRVRPRRRRNAPSIRTMAAPPAIQSQCSEPWLGIASGIGAADATGAGSVSRIVGEAGGETGGDAGDCCAGVGGAASTAGAACACAGREDIARGLGSALGRAAGAAGAMTGGVAVRSGVGLVGAATGWSLSTGPAAVGVGVGAAGKRYSCTDPGTCACTGASAGKARANSAAPSAQCPVDLPPVDLCAVRLICP